jgi:predicted transcriptional regulator
MADSTENDLRDLSTPDSILATAFHLYDLGLSVIPQPYGHEDDRVAFPWKKLLYTRLPRDHEVYGLHRLFAGQCNIAVALGAVSRNLFKLSCLSDEAFWGTLHELGQRNIRRWAVRPGTGQGGDIWLFCANGEMQTLILYDLSQVRIIGSGFSMSPPSEAPTGAKYTWAFREGSEPPIVTLDQMDWLVYSEGRRLCWEDGEPVVLALAGQASHLIARQMRDELQTRRLDREAALLNFCRQRMWPGKAGTTDKGVFLALIQRMKLDSNLIGVFRASERELAELSHRGRKAVHRSLERLRIARLIVLMGQDRISRANRYRFGDLALRMTPNQGDDHPTAFDGVISTHSDTLEPSALGHSALDLYSLLLAHDQPLPAPSIAVETGMSINKVRTALRKLIQFGMVEHRGKRIGYAAIPKTLEEIENVAVVAGTAGKSAKRREKHLEEQSIHAAQLILRARERRDDINLPLEMQPPWDWACVHCEGQIHSKVGLLPDICPRCGAVGTRWERLSQPKKTR